MLIAGLFFGLPGTGQATTHKYAVKASALYNVVPFEWPADALLLPISPLTIGVPGQDSFGQKRRFILTVSDTENFAARSGSVQFSVVRNKLPIVVNLTATSAPVLTLSSKHLRPAEVIGEAGP